VSQRVSDTQYGAQDLNQFEFMHAARGYPPVPRRCYNGLDLANWFLKFAIACRATMKLEPS
jgi:hypothetical protein